MLHLKDNSTDGRQGEADIALIFQLHVTRFVHQRMAVTPCLQGFEGGERGAVGIICDCGTYSFSHGANGGMVIANHLRCWVLQSGRSLVFRPEFATCLAFRTLLWRNMHCHLQQLRKEAPILEHSNWSFSCMLPDFFKRRMERGTYRFIHWSARLPGSRGRNLQGSHCA